MGKAVSHLCDMAGSCITFGILCGLMIVREEVREPVLVSLTVDEMTSLS